MKSKFQGVDGTNRGKAIRESGLHDLVNLSTSCGGSREVSDRLGVGHVVCLGRGISLNNSCSLRRHR